MFSIFQSILLFISKDARPAIFLQTDLFFEFFLYSLMALV